MGQYDHELIHIAFIVHADHKEECALLLMQLNEERKHSRYLIQLCCLPVVCLSFPFHRLKHLEDYCED